MLRYGGKTLGYFRGINLAAENLKKVGNECFRHERTAKGNADNFGFFRKGEHVSLISGYVGAF